MKIALAQIEVIPGQPEKNVCTMLRMIAQAKQEGVALIAFPEMCVGGYLLGDKWLEDSFCRDLMQFNQELLEASPGIALAYGNIFAHLDDQNSGPGYHPNKDGRSRKYNAIYVAQNGQWANRKVESDLLPPGVLPKTLLPNYRFFDDERYFFSLLDVALDHGVSLPSLLQPFLVRIDQVERAIGFELCEDLWCEDYRMNKESINPSRWLIKNGAEVLVNLSSSPWTYGKNGARDRRVQFIARDVGAEFVPLLYVNCVGAQNNGKNIVTFDGGSTVYNKQGEAIIYGEAPYEEELLVIKPADFQRAPKPRNEKSKIAQKYEAIIQGIRHLHTIRGRDLSAEKPLRFIVGISGGVDSAVVATLLSIAVGPEMVVGITMPSRYNTSETRNVARQLARELEILFLSVSIESLVMENESLLCSALAEAGLDKTLHPVLQENIQAKIRGTAILSNLAAQFRAFFTNNGNKIEIATGYATLYGDVGGAVAPIGDLTKAEVFELARFLNTEIFKREVIPEQLLPDELFRFQVAPSAELKQKQVDPFRWGYHDALLEAFTDYRKKSPADILTWYLEGTLTQHLGISFELLHRWELTAPQIFVADLEWFYRQIQGNIFKRVQAPPIIILSKSAYGYDIRESQLPYRPTREYRSLKGKVLELRTYPVKSY
ncbi:NAD(+) synthase [candidate division CSSED10-310 bacterium]|uniref:Glutamine-dependent NAD(+) synthetase n=1 Tax=candidate division CSSED10-310 bacterium TaxID=2855610 RepID=A0ABV6Z559_UNCC1